jgi:hypothetical protein
MILAAVIPMLVIGMLSFLLAARQPRGRIERAGSVVLEYGKVFKALPTIFGVLWTVIFLYLAVVEPPKASELPSIFALVVVITAAIVPIALEVRGVAHRISPAGIERVSPWSSSLMIPWRDVRSVSYEPTRAWFVVDSLRGRVHVSRFLHGLTDFRRALETHVAREKWAAAFGAAPAVGSTRAHAEQGEHELTRTEKHARYAAGLVLMASGAGLTALAWFDALHEGRYSVKAALLGPLAIVLGIGTLVHSSLGQGVTRRLAGHGGGTQSADEIWLTRAYGFGGQVAATLNLYFLGYFADAGKAKLLFMFLTFLVWFLPAKMFAMLAGEKPPSKGASKAPMPSKASKPSAPR